MAAQLDNIPSRYFVGGGGDKNVEQTNKKMNLVQNILPLSLVCEIRQWHTGTWVR